MGVTTFTGPIMAGDVIDTTGTTPGTIRNVGFVAMAQTATITQAGTVTAYATSIVIPAYSHILNIQFLNATAWDTTNTLSVGTSATATELVASVAMTQGQVSANPGASSTRTLLWSNTGPNDVVIYVKSTNTGVGAGDIIVRYIQAENA
jgi:microcystin-dependent protein